MAHAQRLARGFIMARRESRWQLAVAKVLRAGALGIMLSAQEWDSRIVRGGTVTICSDSKVEFRAIEAHRITSDWVLE